MDGKLKCIWKDKKFPEKCRHIRHLNEPCHCDLEPCSFYVQKTLKNLIKLKVIGDKNE